VSPTLRVDSVRAKRQLAALRAEQRRQRGGDADPGAPITTTAVPKPSAANADAVTYSDAFAQWSATSAAHPAASESAPTPSLPIRARNAVRVVPAHVVSLGARPTRLAACISCLHQNDTACRTAGIGDALDRDARGVWAGA